jgi:hypothetical protein
MPDHFNKFEEIAKHPIDPSWQEQVATLWREREYKLRRKAERAEQLRIWGAWLGGAAALAGTISTIIGNLPWFPGKK